MTTKALYYRDGQQITEDEATDEHGTLLPGVSVRVPAYMRDSAGHMLVDAFGQPITNRSGYVFADTDDDPRRTAYLTTKAELGARYKGGHQIGDHLVFDGQHYLGTEYPAEGKITFENVATLDADELKKQAYEDGVSAMTDAWRQRPTLDAREPGDSCTTADGRHGQWWRGKDGKLICKATRDREPTQNEWDISGPLSDSDAKSIQAVRDAAYAESVEALANAWRR